MIEFALPPGLDKAILAVLVRHQGRRKPISRLALLAQVTHYTKSERLVREQIKWLRRQGYLIGSAPGESGGYYLITSLDEYQDFIHTEYLAKITDMQRTLTAMNKIATTKWGNPLQTKFF